MVYEIDDSAVGDATAAAEQQADAAEEFLALAKQENAQLKTLNGELKDELSAASRATAAAAPSCAPGFLLRHTSSLSSGLSHSP